MLPRDQLLAPLSGKPQARTECELALRELEAALATLAKHGLVYHLEPGIPSPQAPWPCRVFHIDQPAGRVVNSQWDLDDLGPGWYPSLEAAAHADGVATQFAGRGGIARQGALVALESPAETRLEARAAVVELVTQWKKDHPLT